MVWPTRPDGDGLLCFVGVFVLDVDGLFDAEPVGEAEFDGLADPDVDELELGGLVVERAVLDGTFDGLDGDFVGTGLLGCGCCGGAGARKMSCAGCCSRDGSAPAAAAAAVPPTTTNKAEMAPAALGANQIRPRAFPGVAPASRNCASASSSPASSSGVPGRRAASSNWITPRS